MSAKIRVGVSSCLLGNKVRYDGGHKLDRYVKEKLGLHVELIPVCPEAECGLPIPREPMNLQGRPSAPRMVTVSAHLDHTDRMLEWIERRLPSLAEEKLCGFVFKAKSPSCGLKIFVHEGESARGGMGLFARAFTQRFPLLPVIDESRLHDPPSREHFLEALFALGRWRALRQGGGAALADLLSFHSHEKLLILAHSPEHYRAMGRLTGEGAGRPLDELYEDYERLLMQALSSPATSRRHVNVLQHILGHFKKDLSSDEKREMLESIEEFRLGRVLLIAPLTLVNHHVRKYRKSYLASQSYLHPYPPELKLPGPPRGGSG